MLNFHFIEIWYSSYKNNITQRMKNEIAKSYMSKRKGCNVKANNISKWNDSRKQNMYSQPTMTSSPIHPHTQKDMKM